MELCERAEVARQHGFVAHRFLAVRVGPAAAFVERSRLAGVDPEFGDAERACSFFDGLEQFDTRLHAGIFAPAVARSGAFSRGG